MPARKADRAATVAATVDEYLAQLEAPERAALAALRKQITEAAPEADEVISYRIPTYRQNGPLVHFAAQRTHLSFTIVSLDVVNAVRDALRGFEISGRTVHFSAATPLPAAIVTRIVRARVRENGARAKR
jgi:uncharacterized protein YdhG (YjbR/CyaY superfamily)